MVEAERGGRVGGSLSRKLPPASLASGIPTVICVLARLHYYFKMTCQNQTFPYPTYRNPDKPFKALFFHKLHFFMMNVAFILEEFLFLKGVIKTNVLISEKHNAYFLSYNAPPPVPK